jgi:hypothetical protein
LYRILRVLSDMYDHHPLPKGLPYVAFTTPLLLSCRYNCSCPYAHRNIHNRSYCGVPMKLVWGPDLLICHRQKCDHISFVCVSSIQRIQETVR